MTETNKDECLDAVPSISGDVESKENAGCATVSPAASYVADDGKKICVICLEDENEQFDSTPCNHSFHSECLKEWLRKENSCPICRCSINDSPVSEHSADESDDDEENHYMFELFLRVRSDNEHFPADLSFNEFLAILNGEEGYGEMFELVWRVVYGSMRRVPYRPVEFSSEDLYAIFTRVRPSSDHFPSELTYEEFLEVLGGEDVHLWLFFNDYFNQIPFRIRYIYHTTNQTVPTSLA